MKVWRELQLAALQISSTETPFSKAQEDETPRVECAPDLCLGMKTEQEYQTKVTLYTPTLLCLVPAQGTEVTYVTETFLVAVHCNSMGPYTFPRDNTVAANHTHQLY